MSKIAFIADLHIANHRVFGGPLTSGINARCQLTLDALSSAVAAAQQAGCGALVIAGDLFDTTRPEPQIVAEVQKLLNVADLHVVLLLGNHDMFSMAKGDHSIGPLEPVADIVTEPTLMTLARDVKTLMVPFEPGPALEWLPKRVDALLGGKPLPGAVLVTHVGISTHDDPPFLKAAHDQVPAHLLGDLCTKYGIRAVFAGNWHSHREFNLSAPNFAKAYQIGTLCPTGWDNPGTERYGTVPIFDSAEAKHVKQVFEVPGPRFLNLTIDTLRALQPKAPFSLYVRTRVAEADVVEAGRLCETLKEQGQLTAYEVLIDDAEVRAQARTAATVARSATTLEGALTSFVEQMPLPDNIDRQEVLARAKAFLG